MYKIKSFFMLYLLLLYLGVSAEIYSSVYKLEKLLETQSGLIENLENFVKLKRSKNKMVKGYLEVLKREQLYAMNDTPRYLGNPVNGFRLVKRLTSDLNYIEDVINKVTDFERNKNLTYPSKQDLWGAADGLMRLQATYGLSNRDLTSGVWNTTFSESRKPHIEVFTPMSISDCFELGKYLYDKKYYVPGIEWMKEANRKYQEYNFQEGNRITLDEIQNQINYGYHEFEKLVDKFMQWFHVLKAERASIVNMDKTQIIKYFNKGLTPEETLDAIADEEQSTDASKNLVAQVNMPLDELERVYSALCRGVRTKQKITSKRLFCYFAHGPQPFLILAPIKVERLHVAPEVLLFYDVINDEEILAIQNIAKTRLARSKVSYQLNSNIQKESTERVCQGSFVFANESKMAARIKARVVQFTGLSLTNSEPLQIINYGIGGFNKLHYDFTVDETSIRRQGNRLATVNFYLSNVEQGGATVFPALDLAVFPVKGTAVYWNNLLPTGQGHPATFHAACPVLLGSKWVAQQWISTFGQEHKKLSAKAPENSKSTLASYSPRHV